MAGRIPSPRSPTPSSPAAADAAPAVHSPAGRPDAAGHPALAGTRRDRVRTPRDVRHAAHVIQTSRRAAKLVTDLTGLDDFEHAMTALEVVVGCVVRRITPSEAGDFLAQLPSELRSRVIASTPAGPDPGLTRETIEAELSKRLDLEPAHTPRLLDQLGTALEHLVSPGEMSHVRGQLPRDLQSIFRGDVAHRMP
jgi:uncharacterized protein (DUF2267 family)